MRLHGKRCMAVFEYFAGIAYITAEKITAADIVSTTAAALATAGNIDAVGGKLKIPCRWT